MVRRMLVRATTKSYSQVVSELITLLREGSNREFAGDRTESFFASHASASRYWPDNDELRAELRDLPAYRRLSRGRLRMVLEAIEDHLRGWRGIEKGKGEERASRGKYVIEHIMPRHWTRNWPLTSEAIESEREALIHTLGNVTLLTGKLNSHVSNGPWIITDDQGKEKGKRRGLQMHDTLFLNRKLLEFAGDSWTEAGIKTRCEKLINWIIEIWPVPERHRSGFAQIKVTKTHKVEISDLLAAGSLVSGTTLVPRRKKFADSLATILSDGRLDVQGSIYESPSEAGKSITGKTTNGWWFFLVDPQTKRSLADVRREYLESSDIEGDDDDDDSDDED